MVTGFNWPKTGPNGTSIKGGGEIFDQLSDYQVLKNDSVP
jgi:hypothetical protein